MSNNKVSISASPCREGEKVLIRTITHYYTGEIKQINPKWETGAPFEEIVLQKVAWVADTGRFGECLREGKLGEVEPYPEGNTVAVNAETIVDVARWNHALPGNENDVPAKLDTSPCRVGEKVLIRTITHYYTGEILEINAKWANGAPYDEIVLGRAAWVADTGRFGECLRNGTLGEVEPYPEGEVISIDAETIVDVARWNHKLPSKS